MINIFNAVLTVFYPVRHTFMICCVPTSMAKDLVNRPGKLVVITGGNRGIGLSVVQQLLKCEMTVVLGVRDPKDAQKHVESTVDIKSIKGKVYYEQLDIGNIQSVRAFAKNIKNKFTKIDVLINNAGVMGTPYQVTVDGFESQLAINYLGHFLLTHLLMPEMESAGTPECHARIVNVSSCVHFLGKINFKDINGKKYYNPMTAYSQSKLAQVLFTKELQTMINQEGQSNVQVHAVHPGIVDTGLFVHTNSTTVPWFKKLLFKNTEEGARTIVHTAVSPKLEGKGGSYLSNCQLHKTNPVTKDTELCKKLFQYTCEILKIDDFKKVTE